MTSYPPLADVRKSLRVDWYRCPIEPARLRELSKRSDLQGWFQAGGHLALFAVTGTLVYLFWSQANWLAFFIALFAHGTVGSFFVGVAPHELGHGTVFRTRWLNKAFMYLFSLLSWWDPFDYASSHTYHHRYTLHPEGDRENLLPLHPSVGKTFLLQMFTVNLLTQRGRTFGKGGLISTVWVTIQGAFGVVGPDRRPINEWLKALHADQPEQYRKSIWWSRALLLFHGSVLVIAIVTGLWVLPLIFSRLPLHRQLARLLRRPDPALRPARERPRFPQERPLDHPRSADGIPLLAHELAHRAPHVRRRPLLQSEEAAPRGRPRHARSRARFAAPGRRCSKPGGGSRPTPTTSSTRPCRRPRSGCATTRRMRSKARSATWRRKVCGSPPPMGTVRRVPEVRC